MNTKPLQVDLRDKPAGTSLESFIKQVAGGESTNKAAKYGPRHAVGEMNGAERAYAKELELRKLRGDVKLWRFECMTFVVVGKTDAPDSRAVTFRPDFFVEFFDGTLECVDVKGAKEMIQDKATIKIKAAAVKYPMFKWVQAIRVKGGWERREF